MEGYPEHNTWCVRVCVWRHASLFVEVELMFFNHRCFFIFLLFFFFSSYLFVATVLHRCSGRGSAWEFLHVLIPHAEKVVLMLS